MTTEEIERRLGIIGISAEALALRAGRSRSAGAGWRKGGSAMPEPLAAWVIRISNLIEADPIPSLPPYVGKPPGRRRDAT